MHGWNVKGTSSDTFQNAALAQDLQNDGFNYKIISVDRVNSEKICEPYLFFKNALYNKRIILYDSPLLTEELLGLERNNNTGKIDHPDGGRSGSKDQSDAVCGALYNASQHSEEYAFEYGENLINAVPQFNVQTGNEKQQINKLFEEQLKQTFRNSNMSNTIYKDFGMGKASSQVNIKKQVAISNGILFW